MSATAADIVVKNVTKDKLSLIRRYSIEIVFVLMLIWTWWRTTTSDATNADVLQVLKSTQDVIKENTSVLKDVKDELKNK